MVGRRLAHGLVIGRLGGWSGASFQLGEHGTPVSPREREFGWRLSCDELSCPQRLYAAVWGGGSDRRERRKGQMIAAISVQAVACLGEHGRAGFPPWLALIGGTDVMG
jgi:hypothetical protein